MNKNSRVSAFIKELEEKELTLALAESMTCGLAAHTLSTCKGTSNVLRGSVVCYHEKTKRKLMKIPRRTIRKYSAESKEVTALLARRLRKLIPADIFAAITGLASAGGSERRGKPVGTVFFCVRYNGRVANLRKVFRGSPLEIREKACLEMYAFILRVVRRNSSPA